MSEGYGSHKDYIDWVKGSADKRQETIESALREAFCDFIEVQEVEVVAFSNMTAFDLAKSISTYPMILKPLLTACNIAARAIERDLSIKNLDTYTPRINKDQAKVIAGYIKPFLPAYLELPTLSYIDRVAFIDKEIRKTKGRWEKRVVEILNRECKKKFRKRFFTVDDEKFEIDAALQESGTIRVGIDIKRIEARRDIHKRCDEIVNKASNFKKVFPESKFGVVVYYPFIEEHINVQNRLRSKDIDGVVFASEKDTSIVNAVKMLLSILKVL